MRRASMACGNSGDPTNGSKSPTNGRLLGCNSLRRVYTLVIEANTELIQMTTQIKHTGDSTTADSVIMVSTGTHHGNSVIRTSAEWECVDVALATALHIAQHIKMHGTTDIAIVIDYSQA